MPLEVRARVDGDRFRPLGVPTLLKLQDLLVNAHLPAPLRNHLPLIAASDGTLLWVPGLRVAETAKVTPATEQTLAITVTPATPQLRALLRLWEGRSYNGEVVAGPETGRHRSSHRDATTPPV
jgi:tRNA(Ile)-lysidine synthetase-like protein